MGAPYRLRSCLGHAEVRYLSFLDKFLDRTGNVLDGNFQVNAVLIEKIEHIYLQALERCLGNLLNVLRTAVEGVPLAAVGGISFEAKLGRDHDLAAKWSQSFADQFLIHQRTIY